MGSLPYTILVGGKAGEGVKKAAQVITQTCLRKGRYVFQSDDYQSLIRGGHNFSVLCTDTQPVHAVYDTADLVICFDDRSFQLHRDKVRSGGILAYNSDESKSDTGVGIPFNLWVKEIYGTKGNPSVAAFAIFCATTGQSAEFLIQTLAKAYRSNDDKNEVFSQRVYDYTKERLTNTHALSDGAYKGRLYSGNQLIILGAWAAGLDIYYGYPMTPASSLLHYAAGLKEKLPIYAVHAESELAAVNMAIGSAFAGCRSAVGSSGGGFALMQEGFSMAAMAEAPLFCINSSRPGPATGVSTYTAQEDLYFALNQGHGEFCRVVASPDCQERAFYLAAELLSIAWKYQIPTLLLTEKHLSESLMNVQINPEIAQSVEDETDDKQGIYQRYAIHPDSGVSALQFPPSAEMIKWNSHEHLTNGLRTDKAADMKAMKEKRHRKYQEVNAFTSGFQRVAIYGDGEKIVFAYGSTAQEIREAMKYIDIPLKLIVPIYLEPFPYEELKGIAGCEAVVVEHGIEGAFCRLLKEKLQIRGTSITKYDGRTFDPIDLAKQLKDKLA